MASNLCTWIKRYLWRLTGMDVKYMQSYLNWYACPFRVRQAKGRWPLVARVVRHLLMADAHFRSLTQGIYHPASRLLDILNNVVLAVSNNRRPMMQKTSLYRFIKCPYTYKELEL